MPTKLSAIEIDEVRRKLNTLIEGKRYRTIEVHLSPSNGAPLPMREAPEQPR